MSTPQNNVGGIGTIKYFDRVRKRGMIARESATQSQADELYFEVDDRKALKLREGQLVQFVMQDTALGLEATEIEVLSDKA
jgi:cold shock CspA family protein